MLLHISADAHDFILVLQVGQEAIAKTLLRQSSVVAPFLKLVSKRRLPP